MHNVLTSPIVEHRVDGWTFRIDTGHAPHYVLVTGVGSPTPHVFLHCVHQLRAVMDELVGPGHPFRPVIFDARKTRADRLSVPAILRAAPHIMRRLELALVVGGPARDGDFVGTFVRAMSRMNPRVQPVASLEEAFSRLRLP